MEEALHEVVDAEDPEDLEDLPEDLKSLFNRTDCPECSSQEALRTH